jgi:leader peptidase (prepilin peptidase) / N-methyltransferase
MAASAALGSGVLLAFAGAFGLLVGSFLNVVIHRVPRGESVVRPRSRCPRCGAGIRAFDNVPVLSWLWLRGRCRDCGAPISWRYPAFELATGLVFAAIAWRYGPSLEALLWMGFAAALLAAGAIDFEHQIIPDEISLGGLAAGLLLRPGLVWLAGDSWLAGLGESALGALLGGGALWAVGFAHARLSVAFGRRFEHWPGEGEETPRPGSLDYWTWFPGLGFGDVKLLAMIGAWLGVVGVVQTILAAALLGLGLGLGWLAVRRRFDAPFGFAPAIALGALLVVLFPGPWLLR